MQLASPGHRQCRGRSSRVAAGTTAALLLSAATFALASGPVQAAGEEADEVAYVEDVSGRVLAFAQGRPVLLTPFDPIGERTRLDLMAESRLSICHFKTQRLFALAGPLQATISREGIAGERVGKASTESCVAPVISTFQGGLALRSAANIRTIDVPLRPTIKLVDRGSQPIRRAALWDGEQHGVLMTFEGDVTRPTLDDRRSYILAVERGDRSEVKLKLRAGAATVSGPLLVVVR